MKHMTREEAIQEARILFERLGNDTSIWSDEDMVQLCIIVWRDVARALPPIVAALYRAQNLEEERVTRTAVDKLERRN